MSRPKFLEEASIEELKARIEEIEKDIAPTMIDKPDITLLKLECQTFIDSLAKGKKPNDNSRQTIFELAMTTFFGHEAWYWINRKAKQVYNT